MPEQNKLDVLFGTNGVETVFHSIIDCRAKPTIHGYEALMRGPKGFPFEGPMLAFAFAKSMEVLEELDLRCLENALMCGPEHRLFLNIHPATAINTEVERLHQLAVDSGRDPSSVVLEIVEHEAGTESDLLRATNDLRKAGFKIAIDDFGEGASNLRRVLRLEHDYLKIDRWFVQGCERDRSRRAVLKSVALLGRELDIQVIAEGVENKEQLAFLSDVGIHLVQGWGLDRFLGDIATEISSRPHSNNVSPAELAKPVIGQIDNYNERLLDRLPFGVIQLSSDGTILQYNRYEESLAGFKASSVIGKNFFRDVAPCTDVREFAGLFRRGVEKGKLHTSFDFVFTFKPPKNVRVTLYLSEATQTIWVFINERPAPP